jgi:putative MATE family efflux protein
MRIQLSEHFTYGKLLRFVLPSVVMMVFTSIYGVVDGLFVSNFVGKTPFAAINLIMPVLMIFGALGFMMGTGGSAIVAKTLGEGKKELAQEYFSLLIYVTMGSGLIITLVGLVGIAPLAAALGAEGEMLEDCVLYGRIILVAIMPYMLQNVFQSLFVTAEKPHLGLWVTVAAGLTNMVLDFVFIVIFHWGLAGAAIATALSQVVGGCIPILYFARPNNSLLRLGRTRFYGKVLLKTCTNGSSELMTNVSLSLVNILYNFQLMRLVGEDGIAAFGVIMYVNFVFVAIFLGYSIGVAPVVGFHYGAGNHRELQNLFRKSLMVLGICGVVLTLLAEGISPWLAKVFVGYDSQLTEMTNHGFRLFAISFLMVGVNIFGSAFFTALSNGVVSAFLSFLRTLVFQVVAVLALPLFLEMDGIWLAIVAAEGLALVVTIVFFLKERGRYHYA